MSTIEVHVPDIGDFDAVEVIEVLVAAGDTIAEEDSIITVESDKATMEIPSPVNGLVQSLAISVGDKVILWITGDKAGKPEGYEAGKPERLEATT